MIKFLRLLSKIPVLRQYSAKKKT